MADPARSAPRNRRHVRPAAIERARLRLEPGGALERAPRLDESAFSLYQGDRLADVALKSIGRQLARLFWHEAGARLGVNPEHVHDMRVATRRLRTALRVFAAAIPRETRQEWRQELRWIGRALGSVRDCDVELDRVRRMAADAPEPERAALFVFTSLLEIKRARKRVTLLERLDSPRFSRFRRHAQPWIELRRVTPDTRAARAPAYIAGPRVVAVWDRRMLEACDEAKRKTTAENVHALRIAIKGARYAVEYFVELEGPGARRRAKHLGRLQNMLGARQDAAVLLRHMRRYARTIPSRDGELSLGARIAIRKISRAARVRKSEWREVLELGSGAERA